MKQYEPCIQNNNNNNTNKKKEIKTKKKHRKVKRAWERRERNERDIFYFFFFSFLSQIYENRTVGFRKRKMQSSSTHRELCVGTKILEFRQTLQGREFSYLCYF